MRRFVYPLAVAVVLASVALFVASLPATYRAYTEPCALDPELAAQGIEECENWGFTEAHFEEWESLGFTPATHATVATLRDIVFTLPYLAVGLVLLARRRQDWFAVFSGAVLVAFGLTVFASGIFQLIQSGVPPWVELVARTLQWVGGAGLLLVLWLFPTGRFVPRWTAWLAPIWVLEEFDESLLPNAQLFPGVIGDNLFIVLVLTGVVAQVYRYRTTSDPVQRQQTKWVVFSVATGLILFTLLILGVELSPGFLGGQRGRHPHRRVVGCRRSGTHPGLDRARDPQIPALGHRPDRPPHRDLRRR